MGKLSKVVDAIESASKALDMSHAARMERARDMGFDTDTVYYHGSPDSFEEFSKDKIKSRFPQSFGFHFSNAEGESKVYSGLQSDPRAYYLRKGEQLNYDIPKNDRKFTTASMKADTDKGAIVEDLVLAQRSGEPYDSVTIKKEMPEDWQDWGPVNENAIVFDPSQIRSVNAAFDPAKKDSANLMAGVGGAAILGGSTLPEEADAAMGSLMDFTQRRANKRAFWQQMKNPQGYDSQQFLNQPFQMAMPVDGNPRLLEASQAIRDYTESPLGGSWAEGTANLLDKFGRGEDRTYMDYVGAVADAL